MVEMHAMKKVEIVIDEAAVDRVVRVIEQANATGYTIVRNVSGTGSRGVRSAGDDIFDTFSNALIIVVTRPPAAERILEGVLRIMKTHAGIVYTVDVGVARPDHF